MGTSPTVIVTDMEIDLERLMLQGVNSPDDKLHTLTVSEVAKVFFGRDAHWLRRKEVDGFLNDPETGQLVATRGRRGEKLVENRREMGRTPPARAYTLPDVERMIHVLLLNGVITPVQAIDALRAMMAMARVWGLM